VAGISSDPVFLGDGNFASSSKVATQGAIREVVGTYISLFVLGWRLMIRGD
jgi:hypothetical protein